jgi:hypothetical protein
MRWLFTYQREARLAVQRRIDLETLKGQSAPQQGGYPGIVINQ